MRGTLYILRNKEGKQIKSPKAWKCEINLGQNDIVLAAGKDAKAKLTRAKVELIGADGLLISGVAKSGHLTLHYQEWWFVPNGCSWHDGSDGEE